MIFTLYCEIRDRDVKTLGNVELDDYLRRDSELEKKEKELKECVQRAQAKIGPNIIAGNSSLKIAVLFRLSLSGQRGLTPKELHRDRLLLNGYVGKRVSSRVATYSMCLNRLVDDGYAEKTKEGRTYRYYRNLAGQEYLRYVLKRDERRQADKAMWKRSQETADLAFFNGNCFAVFIIASVLLSLVSTLARANLQTLLSLQ